MTVDEKAPHGVELVEFLVNDEVFYQTDDLIAPARSDSGMDMHQGPSGPGPKPDDANNDDAENQDDDPMEGKDDKTS